MELIGSLARQAGGAKGGLSEAIGDLLREDGPLGGLHGLLGNLQAKGLGEVGASWVARGKNLRISPEQVEAVLGSEQVRRIALRLGIEPEAAAAKLARYLPQVVDRLTPEGEVPDGATLERALRARSRR